MRVDPLPTAAYLLEVDQMILPILKPVFGSLDTLHFGFGLGSATAFYNYLINGYLPYQAWSLVILDTALDVLGRYTWKQSRVLQVRFPAMDNPIGGPLEIFAGLALTGLSEGGSPASAATASKSRSTDRSAHQTAVQRKDPLPFYAYTLSVDGVVSRIFTVSKISGLTFGQRAGHDLVLSIKPEQQADPFRDWLRNGNLPKSGNVQVLRTDLKPGFRLDFTGLRVQSVVPPLTTFSPNPATVTLTYDSLQFTLY